MSDAVPRAAAAIASPALAAAPARSGLWWLLATLFKLRIAVSIVLSALAGALLAHGGWPAAVDSSVLALGVLIAAGAAGACNHYFERDIDALMRRTRGRPFVTGALRPLPWLPWLFALMMLAGSAVVGWRFNLASGLYVLAGALTYSVVYTLWLKRRSEWNIVIGGAAGSFAVLAGAAAMTDELSAAVLWLTLVLFFWTPSHFWALAIALCDDYRRAGVPMLPVARGRRSAARWTFLNSLLLTASTTMLALEVADPLFWLASVIGNGWLLVRGYQLLRQPERGEVAMRAFRASLIQLGTLLLVLPFSQLGS